VDANERIRKLLALGDNRLKQGLPSKARETFEEALVLAREAGLEDTAERLISRPLAVPTCSTWSVVCSIANRSRNMLSSSSRMRWQSAPGSTRTCAESAGKPLVTVQTWTSCV
jgi:hypothetical protein